MATYAPPPPTVQSTAPSPTGTASGPPPSLPGGGTLVYVQGDMPDGSGTLMVVYDIGNGTKIYYDFSEPGQAAQVNLQGYPQPATVTKSQFYSQPGLMQGGNVAAITSDKWDPAGHTAPRSGQSYQDWIHGQIQIYAGGADWTSDPDMLRIYQNWITHPDLTSDEIKAEIRKTQWFATHTQSEVNYDLLSPTEQAQANQGEALKLQQSYFQTMGVMLNLNDQQLLGDARLVASGQKTEAQIISGYQTLAEQNPGSPLSRSLISEQQAERQRSADISTNMGQLNTLYMQYGFVPNTATIQQQATNVVDNKATMEELTQNLRDQALSKFPGFNPNMNVQEWAQPWTDTFSRLLEKAPTNGIFDPTIQQAMTNNTPVWQFEQQIKQRPDWLNTDNAKSSLMSAAADVGRTMGFV